MGSKIIEIFNKIAYNVLSAEGVKILVSMESKSF